MNNSEVTAISTMSLFPAYSSDANTPASTSTQPEDGQQFSSGSAPLSWLENESFASDTKQLVEELHAKKEKKSIPVDDSHIYKSLEHHRKRKKSRHKKEKKKLKSTKNKAEPPEASLPETDKQEIFREDKRQDKSNLSVSCYLGSSVPRYYSGGSILGLNITKKKLSKKIKILRYFHPNHDEIFRDDVKLPANDSLTQDNAISICKDVEDEVSKLTAHYNKQLTETPNNVELWIEFIRYQDRFVRYQRGYTFNEGKAERATTDRKLAILDKAIQANPSAIPLLKEKYVVSLDNVPTDSILSDYTSLLKHYPDNMVIWQQYLTVVQSDLSRCSATSVSKKYTECLQVLNKMRRISSDMEKLEIMILDITQMLSFFLQQAGLWEKLVTLLQVHLALNVFHTETSESVGRKVHSSSHASEIKSLNFNSSIKEDFVESLEDEIISSDVPLPEMWLKTEKLKTCLHWLPWSSHQEDSSEAAEDCKDPQRIVFIEDVSEFLCPLVSDAVSFRLVSLVLLLLKVPPLPFRDTTFWRFGLNVPWTFESAELILAALFPNSLIAITEVFPSGINDLVVGPQYLNTMPGQEEYLGLVECVFQESARHLQEPYRTFLCIWWLRFQRFLLILDKQGKCQVPKSKKKSMKHTIKDFLKREENRNSVLFYREYALIEKELGHYDGACKIIHTAMLASNSSVVSIVNEVDKANMCSLYRTYCELVLIGSDKKSHAVCILTKLGLGELPHGLDEVPSKEDISSAKKKYGAITRELMASLNFDGGGEPCEHLEPNFLLDWVACHMWLVYLTESCWVAGVILEDILHQLETDKVNEATCYKWKVVRQNHLRECFYEVYLSMLWYHCQNSPGTYSILQGILQRALKDYPNSLHFLALFVYVENNLGVAGSPWWKILKCFSENKSYLQHLFLIFLAQRRKSKIEAAAAMSHQILQQAGPVIQSKGPLNQTLSTFRRATKCKYSRHCPLIWRLYMQFVHELGDLKQCHKVFYWALEQCPWVKAIYLDGAKFLPQELGQIQDLIIEKELRLHVLPEELEILRGEENEGSGEVKEEVKPSSSLESS